MEFRATVNYEGEAVPLLGINIDGLEDATEIELQKYFSNIARDIVYNAKTFLRERILHPERSTGRAEASIGWTPTWRGITVYAGAPYTGYIDRGTRTIQAKWFMEDAFDLVTGKIMDELDGVLHEAVNKAFMG